MPETTTPSPVAERVAADIATIPIREPVVLEYDWGKGDSEDFADYQDRVAAQEFAEIDRAAKLDKQWRATTEVARRAIVDDIEARAVIKSFIATPVSEKLPEQMKTALESEHPRAQRMAQWTGKALGAHLAIDAVPDEVVGPDIYNTNDIRQSESYADTLEGLLQSGDVDEAHYEDYLQRLRDDHTKYPGMARHEKDMMARRYKYARDVKVLALTAELLDADGIEPIVEDGLAEITLPSGTNIVMTEEVLANTPNLVDPTKWEKRTQLKDRVHVITVDGKEYLMKERKTNRHTDTKKGGHKDGLTSKQEFETARHFAGAGETEGEVKASWETPLAYAEFPDGYQFTVFGFEPGLVENPHSRLSRLIAKNPEKYQEEFESVKARAQELVDERPELMKRFEGYEYRNKQTLLRRILRAAPKRVPAPTSEITFDEYADLKASQMARQARVLLRQRMLEEGYDNSDMDGYSYRLTGDDDTPLEIVGFDFEYYKKDDKADESLKRVSDFRLSGEAIMLSMRGDSRLSAAAYIALMEANGYVLPEKEPQAEK